MCSRTKGSGWSEKKTFLVKGSGPESVDTLTVRHSTEVPGRPYPSPSRSDRRNDVSTPVPPLRCHTQEFRSRGRRFTTWNKDGRK